MQGIHVATFQDCPKVDFQVAGRTGSRAAVIETPDVAAGQDAPPDAPLGLDLSSRQVPQDLAVRSSGCLLAAVAGIERQAEPLALSNSHGVQVSLVRDLSGDGPFLCTGIRKQQEVGYVLVAGRTLLREVVSPAEESQHMLDQVLLGDRLVRLTVPGERLVALTYPAAERLELARRRHRVLPLVGVPDSLGQVVVCEQLPRQVSSLHSAKVVRASFAR